MPYCLVHIMDIVRTFEHASMASGFRFNIIDTFEYPLFQANQIGQLLGIDNIHEAIKDFDSYEKVMALDTRGECVECLTSIGVYVVLAESESESPLALDFRRWVIDLVKELQLTAGAKMHVEFEETYQKTTLQGISRILRQAASEKGLPLNCVVSQDGYWFQGNHIGKLLDLSNIHDAITMFQEGYDKKIIPSQTDGGRQKMVFLSEIGVKKLIVKSRKPMAMELAKRLGITTLECKLETVESNTILQIMQAFDGQEMKHQYMVNKYLVDLYFPRFKLAIECDELHHNKTTNKDKDEKRQEDICNAIEQCTFIRYSPYAKDFCIFHVINKILKHILACTSVQ